MTTILKKHNVIYYEFIKNMKIFFNIVHFSGKKNKSIVNENTLKVYQKDGVKFDTVILMKSRYNSIGLSFNYKNINPEDQIIKLTIKEKDNYIFNKELNEEDFLKFLKYINNWFKESLMIPNSDKEKNKLIKNIIISHS